MHTSSHEAELRTFLAAHFDQDLAALPLDTSLDEALGLDSLDGLELMAEIEEHFDVCFPPEDVNAPRTLGNILEALDASSWRKAS